MKVFTTVILLARLSSLAFGVGLQVRVDPVPSGDAVGDGFDVSIRGHSIHHNLHLTRTPDSHNSNPLSQGLQVMSLHSMDEIGGQPQYETWTPSKDDINSSQELYVDDMSKAVFRVRRDPDTGEHQLTGIVNGVAVSHNGVEHIASHPAPLSEQRMDYVDIDTGTNTGYKYNPVTTNNHTDETDTNTPRIQELTPRIVELVIVCDKEFGDIFGHNRQRILDYWTVYMWDMNQRYRTLPSDALSFRVNGIIIISTTAGQPFIEEARGPDGKADFYRILEPYATWVYQQMGSWPAFDLAPLVTNTALEWGGGIAYLNAACRVNAGRYIGTAVWNDNGAWASLTVGAHELGHNLGAPHDDDVNYPGGCSDRGYIMAGATDQLRWYFSSCSDRTISAYVRSSSATCLQQLSGTPILDPSYTSPAAPDMAEQCRRRYGPEAYIEEADKGNCLTMRCVFYRDGSWWVTNVPPVDNTICTGGRCYRGACRPFSSRLF